MASPAEKPLSPQRPPPNPPPPRAPLIWAALVLGALALFLLTGFLIALSPRIKTAAQAAATAWQQAGAASPASATLSPPAPSTSAPQPAPSISAPAPAEPAPSSSPAITSPSSTPPGPADLAKAAEPQPAPAPASPLSPQDFVRRTINEALLLARAARKNGDMQLALSKLREAQALSPDNAEVLAEIAATFEEMGIADKAAAHWRIIYQLGPRAGAYYRAAFAKLNPSSGGPHGDALPDQPLPAAPEAATDTQPRLLIETAETTTLPSPPGSPPSVGLRLVLRAATQPLSAREAKVQVFFYDILDDEKIELTNAETAWEWLTRPVDWRDGTEELRVTYHPAAPDLAVENTPPRRKYLGYIVRVYYERRLQDVTAEPKRLLDLFPPPDLLPHDAQETHPPGG